VLLINESCMCGTRSSGLFLDAVDAVDAVGAVNGYCYGSGAKVAGTTSSGQERPFDLCTSIIGETCLYQLGNDEEQDFFP
jgi:hypothetical protein